MKEKQKGNCKSFYCMNYDHKMKRFADSIYLYEHIIIAVNRKNVQPIKNGRRMFSFFLHFKLLKFMTRTEILW